MTAVVILMVTVLLTVVATAGIVPALRRSDAPPLEPIVEDRLEEQRLVLLRSLRDLRDANRDGALDDETSRRIEAGVEARLAKVLHAIDRRMRREGPGNAVP